VPLVSCSPLCRSSRLYVGVLVESFSLSGAPMLPRADRSTPWAWYQVASSLHKPNPSLCRSSQGKKGMCSLGCAHHHRAPRCSYPHPNIFVFPTNHFLLVLFIHLSSNLPKDHTCLVGVSRGLISSPTKLVVVPTTFVPLVIRSNLCRTPESCPHTSTRTHDSPKCSLHWACPSTGQNTHALNPCPAPGHDVPKYPLPPTLAYLQPWSVP
jgi:hypothetical protein